MKEASTMDKEFRYFDLSLQARIVMAVCLFAAGALVELAFPAVRALGYALIVAGWIPLALKAASNRPDDQGLEDWRLVSMAEIDRLDDGLRESRKMKSRIVSPLKTATFALALPLYILVLVIGLVDERGDLSFAAVNGLLFLVPAYFFGRVSFFEPKEIAFKMQSFRAFLSEDAPSGVTVAPYIRFDKDSKGRDVPEDLRLMLELKRPPEDFVGIQVQAAVNKGPNGDVPYLYAVALSRGRSGRSHSAARRLRVDGFEVESGGDEEYGTVVIRQETSGTGYATTPEDCRRLASVCFELMRGF